MLGIVASQASPPTVTYRFDGLTPNGNAIVLISRYDYRRQPRYPDTGYTGADHFTNGVGMLTDGLLGTAWNNPVAAWCGTQVEAGVQQAIIVYTSNQHDIVAIAFYVARSIGVGIDYPNRVVINGQTSVQLSPSQVDGVMWIRVAFNRAIPVANDTPMTIELNVTQWLWIGEVRLYEDSG